MKGEEKELIADTGESALGMYSAATHACQPEPEIHSLIPR